MKIEEWLGKHNKLGIDIFNHKYKHNGESFEEWLDRVSGGNEDVKKLIREKKFLFGGRILSNRGLEKQGRKVTFSNCYVLKSPEDNIESIFDCAKHLARTFSYGGGVGIDISKLSPNGAKVNNTAKETSGAVSFMDLYSMVTGLIGQNGRRGALMISLDCSHPDVIDFINLKSDLNRVTKANISVKITDDFMKAVRDDGNWTLSFTREETKEAIYKIIKAKEIFTLLCKMNWDYAEPGALFWDRINSWNLLSEDENFAYESVNPCAEEPLPAGGSCLLGSINLSEFVTNPFTSNAKFNLAEFEKAVEIAIVGLNEVLHEGLPLHPLEQQRQCVNGWRQIGLGLFGWHDTLIKSGIRYGSHDSLMIADRIGRVMINTAIKTSALLTDVYGTYPEYNSKAVLSSPFFINNTTEDVKKLVREKGLANSQLLTIAPTGSTATMLSVSTGLEPIFNLSYTRKTESLHGEDKSYKVYTPIVEEYMKLHNIKNEDDLPNFFNTAMNLDFKERIDMQSVWQNYIDASISSTVNLPNSATTDDVEQLYLYAWQKGLKGITIFRDGCKRVGILTNDKKEEPKQEETTTLTNTHKSDLPWGTTLECTDDLIGKKKKIMSGCGSLHVQAWFDPSDGRLMEVYLSKGGSGGCFGYMNALSRLASAGLRTGLPFEYVIDQLQSVPACPSYVSRTVSKKDTSKGNNCPSAVGIALTQMQKEIFDELEYDETIEVFEDAIVENLNKGKTIRSISQKASSKISLNEALCPECNEKLSFSGGCRSCEYCGFSFCN